MDRMNRDKALILKTEDVSFEVIPVLENGWAQVYFKTGIERYFLGADSFENILKRLIEGLNESEKPVSGTFNSQSVYWILSLAEIHTSIYASTFGENINFYIQNRNAEVKFTFNLSVKEKNIWRKQLIEKLVEAK